MGKKVLTLSQSQRENLEKRYKQTDRRRHSERIQAILLLDAGHNRGQTAAILQVGPKTISRWIETYVNAGIDELCTIHSGGNEAALTQGEIEQLATWLDVQVRSTKEALAWVDETFQVSYTESGMRKLMVRMGYSFKKPAPIPAKAEPEAQRAWVASYRKKELA
jgi:transposase